MAKMSKRTAIMDKGMDKKAPAKGGKMPMADKGGKKMPAFLMKMKKGK